MLIEGGEFEEAVKTIDSLIGEEVKEKALVEIKAAEVKVEDEAKAKKVATKPKKATEKKA
ncbi:hypothetical protein ES705_33018 [subsurface metagenome]